MEQGFRQKGYENWLVVIFAFLTGATMLDRMIVGFLLPAIVPDLHLQMWEAGAITSALSVGWAISAWVFGSVSDFKGRRFVILPAIFLFSIVSWITGVVSSLIQMLVARAVVGAAGGPIYTVSLATMAEESTPTRRGFNMSAMSFLGPILGFALGPIIAAQLSGSIGWRWSFVIVGIPGILIGLVLWKFLREPASVVQRQMASAKGQAQPQKVKYLDVLRYRNVWLASIFMVLALNYLIVFATFGMLYLTNVYKMTMMDAGMAISGLGVGASIGMLTLSAVADRLGRRPVVAASFFLAGLALIAFTFVGANIGLLFVCVLLGGLFNSTTNIGGATVPAESVPFQFAATAVAIPVTIGEIFGSTLGPMVAGGLADRFGLTMAMYVAATGAIGAGIVCLLFTETAPRILARRAEVNMAPTAAGTAE